jgi:hypothetical protein
MNDQVDTIGRGLLVSICSGRISKRSYFRDPAVQNLKNADLVLWYHTGTQCLCRPRTRYYDPMATKSCWILASSVISMRSILQLSLLLVISSLQVANVASFQPLSAGSVVGHSRRQLPHIRAMDRKDDNYDDLPLPTSIQWNIRKHVYDGMTKIVTGIRESRHKVRVAIVLATASVGSFAKVEPCHASAPVMAIPKAEGRDPVTEAMGVHQRKMATEAQRELNEMAATARKIEAEQGEAARVKYEKEYKEAQIQRAQEKVAAVEQLKRSLLDEGICPFTDLEGQRQVLLLQQGIDLGKVQGTPFNLEQEWEAKNPARSMKVKKAANRKIIACMVQDMKQRGIDPLDYFQKHQDQTEAILDMKPESARRLVEKYEYNLQEYGQITVPKEGEISMKEKLALQSPGLTKAAEKATAKARAETEKQLAKERKAQEQAAAKAAKIAAKQEAEIAKEQAKVAAAAASAASEALQSVETMATEAIVEPEVLVKTTEAAVAVPTTSTPSSVSTGLSVVPKALGVIAVVGGGGFALKMQREKAAAAEEERRRQFQLLMEGGGSGTKPAPRSAPALEEIVDGDPNGATTAISKTSDDIPVPTKTKRIGLKNVFGKKKNEREVDLMELVSSKAPAPSFAVTLAKLLTFGAPGRFPIVMALPGDMPFMTFDLETAKEILIAKQTELNLSREESAEIFANVVNCMLIDIVDLASTSLGEKDNKVAIDAINIVVDFMNHAASLYLSIAEGVTIKPVTYGGDLSKSKLEQMYSIYAASPLLNMGEVPEDYDNRVALLQDVFEINEKKAQGLMMKTMQKNMAEMLKSGKGIEGMENMMKGVGDGLAGGGADGEVPSPEALIEMLTSLKEMKESGSIPADEFDMVKKQFQETFGSSVDDIVREANSKEEELSSSDKKLLQLMQSIMD